MVKAQSGRWYSLGCGPVLDRARCLASTAIVGVEHNRIALLPRRDRGRQVRRRWSSRMRRYEVMVILDPELDERTVEPSIDQYLNIVRKEGGTVEKLDIWGRRKLAYDVKKKAEGIYAVIDLTAEPAVVKELDRQLTLNESILRTKVIRPDQH